jgi:CRP/FNR family cyclic AMP-dependent transcriptional regulator
LDWLRIAMKTLATSMAVVEETVRISLPSLKGREIILADLPAGELFGEVALLDGRPRSANATACAGAAGGFAVFAAYSDWQCYAYGHALIEKSSRLKRRASAGR